MKKARSRIAALLCGTAMAASAAAAYLPHPAAADGVSIRLAAGWFESAYAEWTHVPNASGYAVYADGTRIDSMLLRQYAGYWRADVPGLKAGTHSLRIVPLINGSEDASQAAEQSVTVSAHDRTGFAFVGGSASGAYNSDGTLRNGAAVFYVTNETKDLISMEVKTDSKGGTTRATGVQGILTAYQKGYETRPLDLRCIGNITDPAVLEAGDLLIKGSGSSKRISCGITVEGIGPDAVFNGFGLRIANASNVEVRNLGFMNCNSNEGDDVGLQQNNDHIWVHNCDFFYGDAGSDADQAKGDGALDTKTSSYVTHSYNHFWDNGKCNLQGMKSESPENYITYHHNWYDHSDSRHPRIRTCSVHIYNNYFDGNAKYGIGVTMGASAFAEANYFRNCPKPMLSSMQGTDAKGDGTFSGETGGIIKAYNNIAVTPSGYITWKEDNASFDAYEVSGAKEAVPASVRTLSGGTSYNNFDTSSVMYAYRADAPADVPAIVTANAGRVQGGDFKWQFRNAEDDASYAVNTALKAALTGYQSPILGIGSGNYVGPAFTQPQQTTAPEQSQTTAEGQTDAPPAVTGVSPASEYVHNFTVNGLNSTFFSISGNLSTGKGTMQYAGLTLTQCLKMESATRIAFTAAQPAQLTLVIKDGTTFQIDGQAYDIPASGVFTAELPAGAHSIAKGSGSSNLFYMAVAMNGSTPGTDAPPVQTTTPEPQGSTEPAFIRKPGDVDCTGTVNIADAILLARFNAEDEEITVTTAGKVNAEVTGDGQVDSDDLSRILEFLAGLWPNL